MNDIHTKTDEATYFKSFLLIILIACTYFVLGWFSLFITLPPSNAAAIWPSSGVALGVCLLWGYRVWPAILIGSFFIETWIFGFDTNALSICVAASFGATAQALTGCYLIHRFIGFPNRLTEDLTLFRFFLLGGPVSCFISASFAMLSMNWAGLISVQQIPINWLNWWLGDTMGILVFTPIVLILFAQPRQFWKQRLNPVVFPLILTFLMVLCLFIYVSKLDMEKQQKDFEYTSTLLTQALSNRIHDHLYSLYALKSIFQGAGQNDAKDFARYAKLPMDQFQELEALSWIEALPGQPNEAIKIIYSESRLKRKKNQLFPPTLYSESFITAAINRQDSSAQIQVHADLKNSNIYFYLPVFNSFDSDNDSSTDYLGNIVSLISIPKLIRASFMHLRYDHINLTISTTNQPTLGPIYSYNEKGQTKTALEFSHTELIQFSNQSWKLDFQAYSDYYNAKRNWTIWWLLISGLSFVCLLGIGLMLITGRHLKTEAIIDERTEALRQEIVERKQFEEELKIEKNKAESASHAKSQFLRNISHELRTPLNGLLGFTQLLQNDKRLLAEEQEKISIIKQCGEYLLTLINDVLDISKIEADQIEIESSPFNLIHFIDDIVAIFKLSAQQKNITLSLIQQGLPHTVISDEKHLRQIVMNLLSNAVKFTATGEVVLTITFKDNTLRIEVKDTGCGIAEKDHQNIFKSFVQINDLGISPHGTGLGLAITNRLIALMGGKLTLLSQPGIGSTFTTTLPMLEKTHQIQAKPKQRSIVGYQGTARHILIVDDNKANLKFLKTLLHGIGFKVSTVSAGKDCLQFCSKIIPDLIYMDMLMPEMSGIKTINALNKMHPSGLKIIGMSASVFSTEKQTFLDGGCFSFLAKPIKQDLLLNSLDDAIKLQWIYQSPFDSEKSTGKRRVLVADDNEINCLLLKNMLENLSCEPAVVNDGKQAYDLLTTQRFDLALIDLSMPVMDGIELIKCLDRSKLQNSNIQIVAISAYVDEHTITETLAAGYDKYFKKPVDAKQLQSYIQKITNN